MNNNQKAIIENLASAYFNPFQLRYELKSTEDVLNELLPHLVTPGALELFEAKLNFLAKNHAKSTHAGFMEEFYRLFDKTPADFAMNAKDYELGIQKMARACIQHYVANMNKMEDPDRENWKTIIENISNPLFDKHLFSELKAARKSDILFKNALSKANRVMEKDALMKHYQAKRGEFEHAGGGQKPQPPEVPERKTFMQRLESAFGLG
jgi:hypothetical protein